MIFFLLIISLVIISYRQNCKVVSNNQVINVLTDQSNLYKFYFFKKERVDAIDIKTSKVYNETFLWNENFNIIYDKKKIILYQYKKNQINGGIRIILDPPIISESIELVMSKDFDNIESVTPIKFISKLRFFWFPYKNANICK